MREETLAVQCVAGLNGRSLDLDTNLTRAWRWYLAVMINLRDGAEASSLVNLKACIIW